MSVEKSLPSDADRLLRLEIERVLVDLSRANSRALADNAEGAALIGEALHEAMLLGLAARSAQAGVAASDLEFRAETWAGWQRIRELSPEGPSWPPELAMTSAATVDRARELTLFAGRELGMHGRALRRIGRAGEQAAEAGAALIDELMRPAEVAEPPRTATPASAGAVQPDGTVSVAVAANQAEADLLRGILADAGIPSTWRRVGGDLPELLGAGYRELYVPAAAAEEAQALLGTVEAPERDDEPDPTRRVGLERTGLRLLGKATALLVVFGFVLGLAIELATANLALGVAALFATLGAGAAIVVWSERKGST